MKDYGKSNRAELNSNNAIVTANDDGNEDELPLKKRRIDVLDLSDIEKKLGEIRKNVDEKLTKQKQSTKKQKNKNAPPQQGPQSSNKSVGFDYSKVDFKQFQGGSQRPQQSNDFKSKFQGKVCHRPSPTIHLARYPSIDLLTYRFPFHLQGKNNKANKQFNKLFAFSNVGKKK